MAACNLRVGTGFDVHRLVPGRPLLLGGLHIPFELGLEGHSDGDALIHAIIDALLGAACLGDIGIFFPPTDDRIKNIHSADMMRQVIKVLKDKGWEVVNVDAVVICEKPKLSKLYRQIAESLSKLIDIEIDRVSVKAKTAEKLGEIGTGNALAVQAVALLEKIG